jgi:hypothetical protein
VLAWSMVDASLADGETVVRDVALGFDRWYHRFMASGLMANGAIFSLETISAGTYATTQFSGNGEKLKTFKYISCSKLLPP